MLILPTEKSKPKINNPKLLILFGRPKAGKSTLMAALDNNLIIDLENGYQALSALVVQARSVKDFAEIANALREKIKELGHYPYKYITIDNATRLEEMCLSYACQLYKQTPMGKSYQGTDIRTLPNGQHTWVVKPFLFFFVFFFFTTTYIQKYILRTLYNGKAMVKT